MTGPNDETGSPGLDPALGAELDRAREGDAPGKDELDALFASIEQATRDADRSPRMRLRAAPTSVRRAIAIASFVAIAIFTYATAGRTDLALYPLGRFVAECLAYATLLGTSLALALRPQHVPSLPRPVVSLFTAATLLATVALAVAPPPHHLPLFLVEGFHASWTDGLPCLYIGLLLGLPVYFLARVLDRGTPLSSVLAAASAGLMGNLALELHCPSVDARHRLVGHASVGFVFLACLGIAYLVERAIRRRRT
ncbi:MAG: hypothetical protein U0230_01830 [Polyangiales bacterium]